VKIFSVGLHNTARFLPPVLQGKQAKLRDRRGFMVSEDTEYTTFLVKFI